MPENNEKPYLTSGEAAAVFHVGEKTVARWAREGKLPHTRTLGGHRRFPTKEMRDLAATLRVEATHLIVDHPFVDHPFTPATFRDAWPGICGHEVDGLPCGYSRDEHKR